MSHPPFTNRLIHEKSPYLLQHAHNPVDWYPWGEEAFNNARANDKPIFLSIGYATCHFCHLMEEESFSNEQIAKMMNQTFVNIKVDREEKPDVDSLYMEFAQAIMSGGAGWPLNVILTPDLMPFFAITYLPADAGRGLFGLKQLIARIAELWSDPQERELVSAQADKIVDVFASNIHPEGKELPLKEKTQEAAELLYKLADPIFGGIKGAPKFPIGYQACFLLRHVRFTKDSRALFYIEKTLDMMHRGGIYDHLGGGFSRYSIDERWLVPHFEKMLYDNAILVRAYVETFRYTRNPFYQEVAEETLRYISSEMSATEGGFFSAQDADSNGHEGLFYTWTFDEIHKTLGVDAPLFCQYYGVTPTGNFKGRNILNIVHSPQDFAKMHNLEPKYLSKHLKSLCSKLLELRQGRPVPPKDDKVITSWNGLMVHAFAEAGIVFHNSDYLDTAEKAATFLMDTLWDETTLYRRWREGERRFDGCLDDYAFVIQGLLSLFEAGRGTHWLLHAIELTKVLEEDFKSDGGAFFLTNGKDPSILLRRCEFYDGAEPSGNAIHAENLLRLAQITADDHFRSQAEDILKGAREHIEMYPPGSLYHLIALMRFLDEKAPTCVIALNEEEEYKEEIEKCITSNFLPHLALIWRRSDDETLFELAPGVQEKMPLNGKTTLYMCRHNRCEEPLVDLEKIKSLFDTL